MGSALGKPDRASGSSKIITVLEEEFVVLLKSPYSDANTRKLWNYLKSKSEEEDKELKSMSEEEEEKRLIKLLNTKDISTNISRMWEKAVDTAVDAHAAAAIKAILPQAVKPPVKFIVKTGKINGGWDTLRFPWASSSKGFPFKEEFEMTISNGDKPNEYSVQIGDIGGKKSKDHIGDIRDKNSNEHRIDMPNILLSVERNPDRLHPLPDAVKSPVHDNYPPKSCVMAFTFGVAPNKIIVYIRFAGPTILVGKAFKENWADEGEDKDLWGDLVLAKHKSN